MNETFEIPFSQAEEEHTSGINLLHSIFQILIFRYTGMPEFSTHVLMLSPKLSLENNATIQVHENKKGALLRRHHGFTV